MSAKRLNPLRIATEAVNAIEGTVQGIEMLRNMRPVDITAARDLLPDLHEATKSIRWLEKFLREIARGGSEPPSRKVQRGDRERHRPMKMKAHPAATLMPKLSTSAFVQLKDDIERHGLREPIWMKNGKIVDGRHRWRACQELGIKCDTKEFAGDDVEAFVMSANLHRRHLTNAQRRALIARIIKNDPSRTDREIGRMVDASHVTVAAARAANGQIDHRERIEASGRRARGRKPADRPVLTTPDDLVVRRFLKRLAAMHPAQLSNVGAVVGSLREHAQRLEREFADGRGATGERAAAAMKPAP